MPQDSQFSTRDLDAAVAAGVIDPEGAARLRLFLATHAPTLAAVPLAQKSRFDLTHLLWYAGALITMSAMGLFSTLAFGAMGGTGLTATGVIYGLGLWYAGHRLWQSEETRTPGGLLIAAAVSMVPMVVFGIQSAANAWAGFDAPGTFQSFYKYIKGGWVPMEVATLVVSVLAARRYPFAFIAFPAALCLWFLSMDITAWVADDKTFSYTLRRQVSLIFGMVLFVAVWIYELRPRKADFAFWLHLVAAITFWGGLTFQSSSSEFGKFLYCLINVGLLMVAIYMGRRVYAVFGVMGIMTYLGHLAYEVFKDSMLFPFALSAFGLAMVAAGIWLARRRDRIANWMETHIPRELMALRPHAAKMAAEDQRNSSREISPSGSTG